MPTVTELVVAEELAPLAEVAARRGWGLEVVDSTAFRLILPAKDGSSIQLQVDCEGYAALPPAWHYRNPDSGVLDAPADTPLGGGFLHSHGVICAPWNRLAYAQCDSRGPHNEWDIGNWKTNTNTAGTKTLCAMALRIAYELRTSYTGRKG
jgi:hypothetical protein